MEVNIETWVMEYLRTVEALFGKRLLFAGLQGSYARGEARPGSDIDVVIITDKITANDLRAYDQTLGELPHRDKICGFVCGRKEIANWDRADLFQFYYDTVWLRGSLDALIPPPGRREAADAVLNGACGIYHMCVHNLVHEKDMGILACLYKTAIFVLKALYYERTGRYVGKKEELMACLESREREILKIQMTLKDCGTEQAYNFYPWSEQLLYWSGDLITEYGQCQPRNRKG